MKSRILRQRDVCQMTGLSKSSIYRLERAGRFPRRRHLSARAVGWVALEVEDWLSERAVVSSPDSASEVDLEVAS